MSRVTLQDIASSVGVDRSTVSRVLGNKAQQGGIGSATAERIFTAAREMNYIPNASASAVRSGQFGCAALMMSTDSGLSYLPARLLDGIHDQLADHDMHLSLAKVPDDKLSDDTYLPKALRTLMSDGLLINYTHHLPPHLMRSVAEHHLPAVWVNRREPFDTVYSRNIEAARAATERLLAMGHTRVAYVDLCHGSMQAGDAHFSVADRLRGYASAMIDAGLAPREVRPDSTCVTPDQEAAFARVLLAGPDRPTAVVCYFAVFVPALLRAAADLGLRVPADLSVVAFAAEDWRGQGVSTSAMVEPHYRMGRAAVRMLRKRIASPDEPVASRAYDFDWLDLGTCAPPGGP